MLASPRKIHTFPDHGVTFTSPLPDADRGQHRRNHICAAHIQYRTPHRDDPESGLPPLGVELFSIRNIQVDVDPRPLRITSIRCRALRDGVAFDEPIARTALLWLDCKT
jgi:hypothetical protein